MLKLSLLASGAVLLDGQPIEIGNLDQVFTTAKESNTGVLYYREAIGGESSAQSMELIKLMVKHKLPVSMSTKPDFSDVVDPKAVFEKVFEHVRKLTARGLVIVRPNMKHLVLPPMSETSSLKSAAANMEKLMPSKVKRNVAVISNASFKAEVEVPDITEVAKSIPFFGMLMGLTYIGHAVWIFEGHATTLAAGCRGADALIVDSVKLPVLSRGWQDTAASVMRNANILIHNRETFQLGIARKAAEGKDLLAFPN